jgi:hypothetical protein
MNADHVKHLEFVQGVINRLAGNSFSIKGWSVTLVAALFALAAKDANPLYAIVAALPALCFWGLDAYYLRQERLFRGLYDVIRKQPEVDASKPETGSAPRLDAFSMNTSVVEGTAGWLETAGSRTISGFHAPIVVAIAAVLIYILCARHGGDCPPCVVK